MLTTADKTTTHSISRRQQNSGQTFFRKAGEESFFGDQKQTSFFNPGIQAKLSVSSPDDPQEKEADEVADKVMRMPDPVASMPQKEDEKMQRKEDKKEEEVQAKFQAPVITVQRKCDECEKAEHVEGKLSRRIQRRGDAVTTDKEKEEDIQRKPSLYDSDVIQQSGRGPPAGIMQSSFEENLSATKGCGSALPESTREFMESRFNADFSGVRIHTNSYAENLSANINAQAFTHGNDIYFNAGKYSPHTEAGGTLLAHELTHTVQQGASPGNAQTTAAKPIARKNIIQRSEGSVPSQLTNAVEKAKTVEGKIDANKPGPDGNRTGWESLVEIFKTTFGEDKIISGSGGAGIENAVAEQDIKKKREQEGLLVVDKTTATDKHKVPGTTTGKRDAMPSWCGIFVFWALNKSGVPMPKWRLGERMIKPEAARSPGTAPLPGDIAYRNAYSHFAIVASAGGGNVTTVNGNTAGEDNLGGQVQTRDHSMSDWTAFFNPLLLMEGSLGSGDREPDKKPKTLSELRKELFNVSRKEDEPGNEPALNTETELQAKPELSNWHVGKDGALHQITQVQASTEKEELQKKEEDKKEEDEKKTNGTAFNVHKKHENKNVNDTASYSDNNRSLPTPNSIQLKTGNDNSSLTNNTSAPVQQKGIEQDRGPPVQMKINGKRNIIQRSVIDDALNYVSLGSLWDCVEITDLSATASCLLGKARDVAMHIPGYKALRVVLGSDPITGTDVPRTGRNFLEAAFDIMPGGEKLYKKLDEQHQLDAAAAWIDTKIGELETIVNDVFTRFEQFWDDLGITDFRHPIEVIRTGANIVIDFIGNIIRFAVDAAKELLEMVKNFLLENIVEFIKEHTTAYPLLTVILGEDPITKQQVDRNGTNILNALLELGGEEGRMQRDQMKQTGTFQKVVAYIDEGRKVFGDLYNTILQNFGKIWDMVTIDALMHPVETFRRIYNIFADPIAKVLDFVRRVVGEILRLIKDVLFKRISEEAQKTRGYYLVTVIIGKDPFTGVEVDRSTENIIHGFMSLMDGGEEQFQQMKESGAIAKTTAKIQAAVKRLNMTPRAIIQLFIDLWNSFSFRDLLHPINAFRRIIATFGQPIMRLIAFVIEIVKIVVEVILIIMNFPFDLINNIIAKAMQAFDLIKKDPIGFLKNLLRAIKEGFMQFFEHILTHLFNGLKEWFLSEVKAAGIPIPTDFSVMGIIKWLLAVLDITMEKIWKKLEDRIGKPKVDKIKKMIAMAEKVAGAAAEAYEFMQDVQQRGFMAVMIDKVKEQLSNVWEMVLDAVKSFVMDQIINKVTAKLLSMLDPTGIMAVINSAIALYKAIQSFIRYLRQMLEIVNSFVEGTLQIAQGATKKAADFLEGALASGIPIVIGFLANQVGLNLSERLKDALELVRAKVDKGLDWVIDKVVTLVEKLVSLGKAAVGKVMGWLGLKKEFKDTSGGDHSIYFEGSESAAELNVASYNPKTVKTLLNAVSSVISLPANAVHAQSYQDAVTLNSEIEILKGKLNNPSNANATNDTETMNQKLTLLAAKLPPFMTMVGGTEPPPLVKPSFTNGAKASSFEVAYLKAGRTSGGSGANTNSGATLPGWSKINQAGLSKGSAWVKMHLLTEQLGGPALDSNLTPARGPQTNTVAYNQVEKKAIDTVAGGKTIWYKIDISYHGSPDEDYPNLISIEFGPYQSNASSGEWEKKPRGTTVAGEAVGGIFSQNPDKPDFSGATGMPNLNDKVVGRVVIQNLAGGLSRPFAEFVQAVRPFNNVIDLETKLVTEHAKRVVKIDNFQNQVAALKAEYNNKYSLQ